jgi:cobalt-zinc-cadmium efflux system membrane fusion protein
VDDGKQTLVFVQSTQEKTEFTMRRVEVTHRFETTAFVRSSDIPDDEQPKAEEREEGMLPKQPLKVGDRVLTRGAVELKAELLEKESQRTE